MRVRKLLLSAFLAIQLTIATNASAAWPDPLSMTDIQREFQNVDNGRVMVVAHRGCWSAAPENSVQAIEACHDLGIEAVEIDVRMTLDNELVVFHDAWLHRMTEAFGYIHEWPLAGLRELRLYERDASPAQMLFRPILTNENIPTLAEVFEAAREKVIINLEIKSDPDHSFNSILQASIALAEEMGIQDHVFWKIPPASRSPIANVPADTVFRQGIAEPMPYVMPIIYQSGRSFEDQLNDFAKDGLVGFELIATDLAFWPLDRNGRIVGADKYRYMGIAVLSQWSGGLSDEFALSEPDKTWGRLIDMGVDMIMTDRPEALVRYLRSRNLR